MRAVRAVVSIGFSDRKDSKDFKDSKGVIIIYNNKKK